MTALVHYRIDSDRRMQRFYRMDVQPNLFGEWCLIREWGRIGSSGQSLSLFFPTPEAAQTALHRQRVLKERRGYAEDIRPFAPACPAKRDAAVELC